jgi:uncharacterized delta-60 repeat protein
MILQNDGKILLAGRGQFFPSLFIYRFNSDGTIDATFGTNGVARFNSPSPGVNSFDQLIDLAVQKDGKIVGVIETPIFSGSGVVLKRDSWLMRLNTNGSTDFSFGNSGSLQSPFTISKLLIQPDGKIISGGNFNEAGANGHFLLARYNPDGRFDPTFAYGGMTAIALAVSPIRLSNMAIRDTRLYAYGDVYLAAFKLFTSGMAANPVTSIQSRAIIDQIRPGKLHAVLSPNPTTTHFVLRVQGHTNKPLQIKIFDAVGRMIESKINVAANNPIRLGDNYRPGVYYAEVSQDRERVTLKMIKGSR